MPVEVILAGMSLIGSLAGTFGGIACTKGVITAAQYHEITGEAYSA